MRKVISEHWFTQGRVPFTFGIVVVEDEFSKERTGYIGVGEGASVTEDVRSIVRNYGGKVSASMLREIADLLEGKKEQMSCIEERLEPAAPATDKDELFDEAARVVREKGVANVSTLQRQMRLGYTRAARLIDQLEEHGVIGPANGPSPRVIFLERAQ